MITRKMEEIGLKADKPRVASWSIVDPTKVDLVRVVQNKRHKSGERRSKMCEALTQSLLLFCQGWQNAKIPLDLLVFALYPEP